jgi:preprotein translocase subunit SecE
LAGGKPTHQASGARMAEEITIEKSFLKRTQDYFRDVRVEMKRVTWPGRMEIQGTTAMVIITTFLFGFYFWICDSVFQYTVGRVLSWFTHKS